MIFFDRLKEILDAIRYQAKKREQDALNLIAQGNDLEDGSMLTQALQCYDAAIMLAPKLARTYLSRGNILLATGDATGALEAYAMALVRNPIYAAAYYNSGNAFFRLGQLEDALCAYNKAIELEPHFVNALVAHGRALEDVGRLEDAVTSYRKALVYQPDYAEVHSNLGNVLKALGYFEDALASYQRAVDLQPDYAGAHNNLGNIFKEFGRFDSATASLQKALELDPGYVDAYSNLGNVLQELGRVDDAIANFRRALELDPGFAPAHSNLGNALATLRQFAQAEQHYRRALELDPNYFSAYSNLLFLENSYSVDVATLFSDAQYFGEMVQRKANRPTTTWPNVLESERRIRVGFVSGDLWSHPVGYFVESILAALASDAAEKLELFAYQSHFCSDQITVRIKGHCHGWRVVIGVTDEALAQLIRDDGIDILVDLAGHTAHNRLPVFAWKPAPVQVSWLGYFATTGVSAIDYLIADPWTLPESDEVYFTEKIWRFPETRLCLTAPDVHLEVTMLPAINNGYVTFACFNNLTKMSDNVVGLWARVLAAVPNSRLFLKAKQLTEPLVRQTTMERFAVHGVDVSRLIFEGLSPRAEYLSSYQRVDIALDPFPYPGGTTSAEALWMGVPVLTLAGENFLSRQGVGLLMNAGLPEWIATDTEDYVARAALHADNLQRLAELRNGLRQQVVASPLFDNRRFARHFEGAMREMWRNWCDSCLSANQATRSP